MALCLSRRDETHLLHAVVSSSPLATAILKPDGVLLRANAACLALVGLPDGSSASPGAIADLFAVESQQRVTEAVHAALDSGSATFESAVARASGPPLTVQVTLRRAETPEGNLLVCNLQPLASPGESDRIDSLRILSDACAEMHGEQCSEGVLSVAARAARALTGARESVATFEDHDTAYAKGARTAGATAEEPGDDWLPAGRARFLARLLRASGSLRLGRDGLAEPPHLASLFADRRPSSGIVAAPIVTDDGYGLVLAADGDSDGFAAADELLLQVLARTAALRLQCLSASKQLRSLSAQMDTVFSTVAQPLAVFDARGRTVRANHSGIAVFGCSPPDGAEDRFLAPASMTDMDGSPLAAEASPSRRALRGEVVQGVTYRMPRPERGECIVSVTAVPLLDDGRVQGLVATALDTTEIVRAREAEQALALFPEENPNAVLRTDDSGVVLFANRASQPLLAHWRAGVGGPLPRDLLVHVREALASGRVQVSDVTAGSRTLELQWVPIGKQGHVNIYSRDVSERAAAARESAQLASELARERDVLGAVMEHTEAQLAYLDDRFRYVMMNTKYATAVGLSRDDMIGRNHFDLLPNPRERALFEQVRATGDAVAFREVPMAYPRHGQAGPAYWNWTLTPVKGSADQVQGLVFSLIDVTASVTAAKRLEELAQEAERRASELEATIASIASGVIIRDTTGHIVRLNEPARRLFFPLTAPGQRPDTDWAESVILERPDGRAFSTEDLPSMRAIAGQTVDSELALLRRVGSEPTWIITTSAPIRDSTGRQLGVVSTYADVTELRDVQERLQWANRSLQAQARELLSQREELVRAGAALEAERERLAVTLRSIGDGVIATDAQGRVVLMNGVAETLTGWSEKEARGLPLSTVFHIIDATNGQRIADPVRQVLDTGRALEFSDHLELVGRNGVRYSLADSGAPIRTAAGETLGVVLVFRDVTVQRGLDAEIARANKLESLGLLAGGIAHDFNNLLTAIVGNISLCRLEIGADRELGSLLADAEGAAMRARELTQQLLTFSKGGAPIPKEADLALLVREAARFVLRGSKASHTFQIADDLWPVSVDEGQIAQVIQNLVINADEAMPAGGTIAIGVDNVMVDENTALPVPTGPYVRVTVADEGVGIEAEDMARVFDPYFTTKEKGSGLGLAVSYSVVNKHEGCITVQPRPGGGTVFTVYLPAAREMHGGAGTVAAMPPVARGRVLVMDDEEVMRSVARRMLWRLGYEVELACDGAEAVALYRAALEDGRPYDAVVLDLLVMSGMGGRETLQQLRRLDPEVRAVVASSYSGGPFVTRYGEYGFAGALTKPYDLAAVSTVLREVIER